MRPWSAHVLALALASGAVGHALWSAAREGWTYDEAFHLTWSERFLDTGVSERTSQERLNSKTPIMVPAVLARKAARAAGVTDAGALRFFARAPSALWLALLLGLVYAAGREVGPLVGALAVAATALDPNLAAHASLATADLPYACATLATLLAAHRLWTTPSLGRAALFGAALGLAFVAKVSAVLLLPSLAVLPVISRREAGTATRRRLALLLLLAGIAAWAVVCGAYGLRELGRPLAAIELRSGFFTRLAAAVPGLRLPLPAAFVTAFDASLASERRDWNVVVLGHRYARGVWFYFALMWLLKTPLLLLAAEIWGLVRAASQPEVWRRPWIRLLAFTLVFTLAYFSLAFHAQIGYRYVLMAVPLAYVIAAAGLATLPPRPVWTALAAAVLVTALAENAAYLGNPISFTNAAVQPKRLAYLLLADSNIDWGQNRERIDDWLAAREWGAARVDPVHILPGRNVIDLNLVAGVGDFEQYRWVREHLRPDGHLGHTWLWYWIDDDTFNRFLYDARRRTPDPFAGTVCPATLDYTRQSSDGETAFSLHRMPRPDETWITCAEVRRDTDVGFRVSKGSADVGVFVVPGVCRAETVPEGQEAWWRLEPGMHALCLVVQLYKRTWLPYQLEGSWRVHGRSVRLAIRPLIPESTPPPPEATSRRSSSPPRPPGD
ncbi:MAG TPA: glycosyltransferase family 39 protein [Vicinamibacteria bacterium]|nr:glycosyltransferase family 39 protein [Vicinamibacteria bacterium]